MFCWGGVKNISKIGKKVTLGIKIFGSNGPKLNHIFRDYKMSWYIAHLKTISFWSFFAIKTLSENEKKS